MRSGWAPVKEETVAHSCDWVSITSVLSGVSHLSFSLMLSLSAILSVFFLLPFSLAILFHFETLSLFTFSQSLLLVLMPSLFHATSLSRILSRSASLHLRPAVLSTSPSTYLCHSLQPSPSSFVRGRLNVFCHYGLTSTVCLPSVCLAAYTQWRDGFSSACHQHS